MEEKAQITNLGKVVSVRGSVVDIRVVGAPVSQPVDQGGIGMESKDDRLVLCEEIIKIRVA